MKKVLTSLLCVVMVVCFMPTMAWADATTPAQPEVGTVEKLTDGLTVDSTNPAEINVTTTDPITLEWANADPSVGRYQDGWWAGIKVNAPATLATESDFGGVTYTATDGQEKSFWEKKDSSNSDTQHYLTCWLPLTEASVKEFAAANRTMNWTYTFNWKGTKQVVKISIDPKKAILKKDGAVVYNSQFGTVDKLTDGLTVDSTNPAEINVTTIDPITLEWANADPSVGRYQDGWWAGIKVNAPATLTTESDFGGVTYMATDGQEKSFWEKKDSSNSDTQHYLTCWLPLTKETAEQFASANRTMNWTYTFNWKGTDQVVKISIDPKKAILKQDGEVVYKYVAPPYIPPTTQTPTIEADETATVTLSDYGTKATIKVADGYELVDVTVNGESKGKVGTLTGLKTGDKVVVTTKKIEAPVDPAAEAARIKAGVENTTLKIYSGKTGKGDGWIQIRWVKSKGFKVDGYEVYRGKTKSSMKKYDTTKKTNYKNAKYLKKGNRYYYKVRGYRMVGDEKVYTKWSKTIYRIAK